MSVTKLTARIADVGGIPIARVLPNKGKEPIAAWCFLDHAGPATFADEELGMQVGRHPHTNLQTFTWMLSGEVLHKDSIGNQQIIRKNQVNLMTAGTGSEQGISHTEQSVLAHEKTLHAVQLWIALPMNQRIERSFYHYPNLPTWQKDGVTYTLTTGRYQDDDNTYIAPTLQYSKLIGLDTIFDQAASIEFLLESGLEYGILVVVGEVVYGDQTYKQDELIRFDICQTAERICLTAPAGTHLMLLGGEQLPHRTLLWWNFVDSTKAGLEQSIIDWNNHHPRFGDVAGDMPRLVAPALPEGFKGE